MRLAAEVGCDVRTARAWLQGKPSVQSPIVYALVIAAKKLGIKCSRRDGAAA